jgi:uncharacterized protein
MNLFAYAGIITLCVVPNVALTVQEFPLSQVQLLDGPFRDAATRNADWLLAYDMDRLLAGFRESAGLKPKAERYGGWEQQGVAGHTLGHYLSACAAMQKGGDARFTERVRYIVHELAVCQDADEDGYVGAIPDGRRIFAEIARGDVRAENFQLNGVWVPWYTMHKVMAGLRDAWRLTDNEEALRVYRRLGDWALQVTDGLNQEQIATMLQCEHGGMNEVAADLFAITGEEKYLELAKRFNHKAILEPAAQHEDRLNGLHANTQFPKFIGAARQFELAGDAWAGEAARFFWETVVHHHSYVTGGNSDHEHFGKPDQLNDRLSAETTETCNTYNMLKLTRHLFMRQPLAEYADYYERALFNHILGSQDPDTGRVMYYVPLQSGLEKTYQTLFDTFSCCVGTGMENHTQYGSSIYFHDDNALYVNLFIASELTWPEKGITIRQDTQFPEKDAARLSIKCYQPVKLALNLRYPSWAQDGVELTVNGVTEKVTATLGEYILLDREWKNGDVLTVRYPMRLHFEAMPDNPNRIALFYGPTLLAGALGKEERTPATMPVLITEGKTVEACLQSVPDEPLTFKTNGIGYPEDVKLIPFYKMHHQRHIVYWDVFTRTDWDKRQAEYRAEQERIKRLEARTLDFVQPGEMQPERDHAFDGVNSRNGMHLDRKWRDAADGWFAFTMKVAPDQQVELICTYWGSDAGPRVFDIVVDDAVIATQQLDNPAPGKFVDVNYALPLDLTRGKDKVRVMFKAHPGMMAGGIFGLRTAVPE